MRSRVLRAVAPWLWRRLFWRRVRLERVRIYRVMGRSAWARTCFRRVLELQSEMAMEMLFTPSPFEVYLRSKGGDTVEKTLDNSDVSGARKNVPDLQVYGNGDAFELICKASSKAEGWMKSTKAMEIENVGCIVQVTTQQRNPDGSYAVAEAVTFVPGVKLARLNYTDEKSAAGYWTERKLVAIGPAENADSSLRSE